VAHTHSYYFKAGTHNEGGTQEQATSHPFVKYSEFGGLANDLHLAGATTAGYTLAAEYNTDPEGLTRGADGVWDRGAFEYNKTNIEYRLQNDECRIPHHPTLINDLGIYNLIGMKILPVQAKNTGIYLVPVGDNLRVITKVK
jgi:hypothetical protein